MVATGFDVTGFLGVLEGPGGAWMADIVGKRFAVSLKVLGGPTALGGGATTDATGGGEGATTDAIGAVGPADCLWIV